MMTQQQNSRKMLMVRMLVMLALVSVAGTAATGTLEGERTHRRKPRKVQKIRSKNFGVIGILSVPGNRALRDAQRATWLNDKGNNVIHRFLIDSPSTEMEAEHAQHRDIYFLHSK